MREVVTVELLSPRHPTIPPWEDDKHVKSESEKEKKKSRKATPETRPCENRYVLIYIVSDEEHFKTFPVIIVQRNPV